MSGVQTVTVAAGEGDQRLDRWLKRRFPQLTQGRIEKGLPQGRISPRRRTGETGGSGRRRTRDPRAAAPHAARAQSRKTCRQ